MCNNCIHKPVCSIYRATGGVKSCEHHKEERKGHWVATPVRKLNSKGRAVNYCDIYHCSECGTGQPIVPPYTFCPNCGADMRGAEDD
jgi:hypothetical protein